jgi:hypothetical protein
MVHEVAYFVWIDRTIDGPAALLTERCGGFVPEISDSRPQELLKNSNSKIS